jgi:acetyl esterase/lipase
MWIGDKRRATKTVVFFHGGGYVQAISWGHLEWCLRGFVQGTNKAEVAVAALQYGLAPTVTYPGQLRQAVAALNHLLRSGIQPQDIIVGGDSSGGNLTLLLLAHILRPLPDVEPVQGMTSPFAGAFTVSPWAGNRADKPSWRENDHVDAVSSRILVQFGRQWYNETRPNQEGRDGNDFMFPLDADPSCSWLDGLSKVTNSLYITAGKHEILRDDILAVAEGARRRNSDVEVVIKLYKIKRMTSYWWRG